MTRRESFHIVSKGRSHIFGIEIVKIAVANASDTDYYVRLQQRQTDFVNCLIGSGDESVLYDLRYVCQPNASSFTKGTISIALLCRIDNVSRQNARLRATELFRLVQSFFENEFDYEPLNDPDRLAYFLRPFEISHAVRIERRTEIARLNSLFSGLKRGVGFRSEVRSLQKNDEMIYHVSPFLNGYRPIDQFFKILLWQDSPVAASVRFRPTRLSEEEAGFIEQQIARCEAFSRWGAVLPDDDKSVALESQAKVFYSQLVRSLGVLKDNASQISIELAGAKAVPQTIVDVFGAYLTLNPGIRGDMSDPATYLGGGFVHRNLNRLESSVAEDEWQSLLLPAITEPLTKISRLRHLFDATEATCAFKLPAPALEELPGIESKSFRTQLFAGDPTEGQFVGTSRHNNLVKEVRFSRSDRRRHLYAVGQTGTGKTTMFESMILDDIKNGEGVGIIDPHGDLIDKLLRKIPKDRAEDVIILDPGDMERPVGFNVLEYEDEGQKEFLIQELLAIIERLMREYDPSFAGPVFHLHSKMVLKLVMSNPQRMGTLVQFYNVFSERNYFNRFIPLPKPDRLLEAFVEGTLKNTDYTKVANDGGSMGSWIASKFEPFVGGPMLRNIFGQQRSTIDLRKVMDEGKILFINLSKGRMGEMNSRFFGMVLIAKLQAAAMSRAAIAKKDRRDFYLYVDEFQNLAHQNFGVLLAEARKYRLNLILTNQFVTQVPSEIMQAITGNVGSLIAFRVGSLDAEFLERDFAPYFNRFDLMNLPNFHTYVSTLIDGEVSKPFSMRIVSDLAEGNEKMAEEVRTHSRAKFGVERELVEQMIEEDLAPRRPDQSVEDREPGLPIKGRRAFDITIDDLELSIRTFNCLKKAGARTLGEIVKWTRDEWKEKCPKQTNHILNELEEIVASYELEFGMQISASDDDFDWL